MSLTVLDAEKSRSKLLADLVSGEAPFPDSHLCPHMVGKARGFSGVLSMRTLTSFMRALPP